MGPLTTSEVQSTRHYNYAKYQKSGSFMFRYSLP